MINEHKDVFTKAILKYGEIGQLDMVIEEMAELTKEICKSKRGADNKNKVCEELADVYIMLEQLRLIYDLSDEDVNEWITFKVRRLQGMLKEDKV